MKHKCLDWNKGFNFMGCEKLFGWKPAQCVSINLNSFIGEIIVSLLACFVTDVSISNHNTTMYLRNVRLMDSKLDSLPPPLFFFLLCVLHLTLPVIMGRWLWEDISCLFIRRAVELAFCGSSVPSLNSPLLPTTEKVKLYKWNWTELYIQSQFMRKYIYKYCISLRKESI